VYRNRPAGRKRRHFTPFAASIRSSGVCRLNGPSWNSFARITPSLSTTNVPGYGMPSCFPLADRSSRPYALIVLLSGSESSGNVTFRFSANSLRTSAES